jgi:antitoxin PrlF
MFAIRTEDLAMKAIVADRGQVTIPKVLRERLGIVPRTVLDFHEENGRLIAEKTTQTDPVAEVIGCLKLDKPTDRILDDLRGGA